MSDISQDFVDAMRAHAAKAHPREACGVLAGPADECRFERFIPMRNVSDRTDEYSFDPDDQLAVWQALEDLGECVWGIYHSYPTTSAWPSKVDIATAQPDMLYVIVGFDREVRTFRIVAPAPTVADLQSALSGQRVQRMTDEALAEDWGFVGEAQQLMAYLDELLALRGMHIQPRWRNEYVNLFVMILIDGPIQDLHPHQADGYKIAWAIEELVIRLDRPYLFQLFSTCLVDALEWNAIKSSDRLRWKWLREQADLHGTRAVYDRVIKKGERSSWVDRINPPAPKPKQSAFDEKAHNTEMMRKFGMAAAARLAA